MNRRLDAREQMIQERVVDVLAAAHPSELMTIQQIVRRAHLFLGSRKMHDGSGHESDEPERRLKPSEVRAALMRFARNGAVEKIDDGRSPRWRWIADAEVPDSVPSEWAAGT